MTSGAVLDRVRALLPAFREGAPHARAVYSMRGMDDVYPGRAEDSSGATRSLRLGGRQCGLVTKEVCVQIDLKYGCNPHQQPARLILPASLPCDILHGTPGYINIMDALGAWQLVQELRQATGQPAAASFKHTSPAGAAVARPVSDSFKQTQMLPADDLSPVANAYVRARAGDRVCAYGDALAVSETVDVSLARVLWREVSDLIVAPDYEPEALEMLKRKKRGGYVIIKIDPAYEPAATESRILFGMTLEQPRNTAVVTRETFQRVVTGNPTLPDDILETLVVATIALKYTQSNSVCVAYDGQVIGMGAGQQSRIHCTRLACDKADKWFLQQHPRVLDLALKDGLSRAEKHNVVDQYLMWDQLSDLEAAAMLAGLDQAPTPLSPQERLAWINRFQGVCLSSDAFLPFRDNIDRAGRSNVTYVAQPGNSLRDREVEDAANQYGMVMMYTGLRCFLH
ncbi:Bifunctional purine biosynthesis protein PurH [Candidatus Entotheonellaceae bacterium PAL068K]